MAKFIIEIDNDILKDMSGILENEAGISTEQSSEVLEILIKEGLSSYDYSSPHSEEIVVTNIDQ